MDPGGTDGWALLAGSEIAPARRVGGGGRAGTL